MLATVNFVWVPPILQFTWEACVGSAFARKLVPVKVMPSVCDAEVLAGEVFGLMLVRVGSGFAGGLMMKAMGLERPLFVALVAGFRVMMVATPGLATSAAETVAGSPHPPPPGIGGRGGGRCFFFPFAHHFCCENVVIPVAGEARL